MVVLYKMVRERSSLPLRKYSLYLHYADYSIESRAPQRSQERNNNSLFRMPSLILLEVTSNKEQPPSARKMIISVTVHSTKVVISEILLAQLFNVPTRFPKLSSSFANLG